ncbi:hypothetical protein HMPREF3289_01320 [Pseudomonas sp. HMSC75E02]|uniref:hypothetical protein n=1 Tax=Pseudomonas sp. HMSC75E02 TaxID=1608908 RepID=UPI0008A9077E|nr:hypothetical protein [Pseudomonas sp. HMSC75E02]OHS09335.1 hypothetical protein HMPREF3289_01320 [Pseudomonas sp. HMSC75E02]
MTEQQTRTGECWSANDEDFTCFELAELLNDNDELKPGDVVFRGEAITPDPSSYIDADDVIELIGERAYDDAGDHADGWPDVSKEAEAELDQLLKEWMRKHCSHPPFYRVKNSIPYVLSAADFEA